jgi:hypothetical protein
MADGLDWLRERFPKKADDESFVNGKILAFRPTQPVVDEGATALELVDQAAEIVAGIEDHARQMEARTELLVKNAIEKMRLLEDQLESAAQEKRIIQSRLATAEAQLLNAEQRTETAETRGRELEYALSRIEDAIRKRLLGVDTKRTAVA